MPIANEDSFVSSFPIWMTFIVMSFLIVLPRTSGTMLGTNSENRILVLLLIYLCFIVIPNWHNALMLMLFAV